MPGLIPLMLRPTEPTKRTSTSRQAGHVRSASATIGQTPRPILSKRSSQAGPPRLPVIPYTQAEWRRAISEIKQQHRSRRYRACAARCAEILDNLKDTSEVEPAYLLCLHFYAAASMEMCTRPLPLSSPYRTALLQQARTHYDRATPLLKAAEDSVAAKTRSGSANSSRSSSPYSPSCSVSSRTWTAATSVSSPSNSVCSFEELATPQTSPRRPCARKQVKKVSFSLPLSDQEEQERKAAANFRFPEPLIRPDSPTLGFDDEYFHAGAALRDLPQPPKSHSVPAVPCTELPLRPEADNEEDPRIERSVHRYNETLSDLRALLASHSHNLGAQLVLAADVGSRPPTPASPGFEKTANTRAADKQARLERLRRNGWQRKRFDARRYEELAQEVLAELE